MTETSPRSEAGPQLEDRAARARRRRAALILGSLGTSGALWAVLWALDPAPVPGAAPTPQAAGAPRATAEHRGHRFHPGEVRHYGVELRSAAQVAPGEGLAVAATFDLRATLEVTVLSVGPQSTRVRLRWLPEAVRWQVGDQAVPEAEAHALLTAAPLEATWHADGRLTELAPVGDAPPTLRSASEEVLLSLQGLLAPGALADAALANADLSETAPGTAPGTGPGTAPGTAPDTATAHRRHATGLGQGRTAVETRRGPDGLRSTLRRAAADYTALRALGHPPEAESLLGGMTGSAWIDADGRLREAAVDERLTVRTGAEVRLEAHLTGRLWLRASPPAVAEGAADPTGLARGARSRHGHPAADARRQALVGRVAGLTFAEATALLRAHGRGGQLPEHARSLWRLEGLLLLEPARCAELVPLFAEPELGDRGRALVLDVLASVGHREAQAAMRAALEPAEHRADPAWRGWVQRFVLVTRPDAETVTFLADSLRSLEAASASDQGVDQALAGAGRASAHAVSAALGAVAARLQADDPERAAEVAALLTRRAEDLLDRSALGEASPADARYSLQALANTRAEAALPTVLRGLGAADVGVRAAAAEALGDLPGVASHAPLLSALADPVPTVRQAAMSALGRRAPHPALLAELAAHLDSGAVPGTEAEALTDALLGVAAQHHAGAAVAPALEALARQPGLGRRAQNRLRDAQARVAVTP